VLLDFINYSLNDFNVIENIQIYASTGRVIKTIPSTFVDISAVRANFRMKFTQPLINKIYSLSPIFVEICLKMKKSS